MASIKRVPNLESTARDHLANERTFLAWVRTGLGVIGLGLIFEKILATQPNVVERIVSLLLLITGATLVVYGAVRYYQVCAALREGDFVVASRSPLLIAIAAVLFVLLVGVSVLAGGFDPSG